MSLFYLSVNTGGLFLFWSLIFGHFSGQIMRQKHRGGLENRQHLHVVGKPAPMTLKAASLANVGDAFKAFTWPLGHSYLTCYTSGLYQRGFEASDSFSSNKTSWITFETHLPWLRKSTHHFTSLCFWVPGKGLWVTLALECLSSLFELTLVCNCYSWESQDFKLFFSFLQW